jgi:hypothetical protein
VDLSFLTPEVFNTIIMVNLIVGVVLVVWRFAADMRRPLDQEQAESTADDDPTRTQV